MMSLNGEAKSLQLLNYYMKNSKIFLILNGLIDQEFTGIIRAREKD